MTGIYVCGRPGIGKTHTIRQFLKEMNIPHHYEAGGYTPKGLFRVMQEHPGEVIVLDDVATVFQQPKSKELLLAALGNQPDGRVVTYRTDKGPVSVHFTGGIIAISNLSRDSHDRSLLQALYDRINIFEYELDDEEVVALLYYLADQGPKSLPPDECREVLEYLLAECQARTIRPTVRLYLDKALSDYRLWKDKKCESDWRDLVNSNLHQQLALPAYPVLDLSKADKIRIERKELGAIMAEFLTREEQLDAWIKRTGKSRATFDRRLKEWKEPVQVQLVA